jgi:hypothetical protein
LIQHAVSPFCLTDIALSNQARVLLAGSRPCRPRARRPRVCLTILSRAPSSNRSAPIELTIDPKRTLFANAHRQRTHIEDPQICMIRPSATVTTPPPAGRVSKYTPWQSTVLFARGLAETGSDVPAMGGGGGGGGGADRFYRNFTPRSAARRRPSDGEERALVPCRERASVRSEIYFRLPCHLAPRATAKKKAGAMRKPDVWLDPALAVSGAADRAPLRCDGAKRGLAPRALAGAVGAADLSFVV